MELFHWVVTLLIFLSAQVQRQTSTTPSEMFSSCLKFKSLASLEIINSWRNAQRTSIVQIRKGRKHFGLVTSEQFIRTISEGRGIP